MPEPRPSSNLSVVLTLAAVVVLLLVAAPFFLFVGRNAAPGPIIPVPVVTEKGELSTDPGDRLSLDAKRELLKMSQHAVAYLENAKVRDALKVLAKIQTQFPEDPFAARNIAIAVSGEAKVASQITAEDIQLEEAEAAALNVLKAAPNDPISHILAARIAAKLGDNELAYQRYQKAVEVDPKSAVAWYELFDMLRAGAVGDGDPMKVPEQQEAALLHVWEIRPDNLRVLIDLIDVMLKTHNVKIAEVVKGFETRMPLLVRMYEESKSDGRLATVYPAAVAAISKEVEGNAQPNWDTITTHARPVKNLILSLGPVLYDLDRLHPNSLDFIQVRFESPALNAPDLDIPDLHPAIPVTFAAATEQLPLTDSPLDIKVEDYNLDERADIWVLTPGKLRIYGTSSTSATWKLLSELPVPEGLTKLLVADLDWDNEPTIEAGTAPPAPKAAPPDKPRDADCQQTDADVLLYGPAGIRIFKNELAPDHSTRTWVAIDQSGLEGLTDVTAVTPTDFDHEGDFDLAVGTPQGLQLWSNREQFTFKNVGDLSVLPPKFAVRKIIAVDFDRDVDLDLLVFGDGDGPVTSGIMINHLHGVLEWRTFEQQELGDLQKQVRSAIVIDADRNVSWDLLGTGPKEPALVLTRTTGPGMIKPVRTDSLPDVLNGGIATFDLDNDGFQDVVSWDGQKLRLLRGAGSGKFTVQGELAPAELPAEIKDCHPADIDLDGDLDLVVCTAANVLILANDGGHKNYWVDVRVRAQPRKNPQPAEMSKRRVNHQGIDSILEINSGGYYMPQLVTSSTTHFGLGQREFAEQIRVIWTNGVPQDIIDAKRALSICEVQAAKGSCPFSYTWDGEKFTFFTDLLWNAPLGLQFAEGVIAPARQWEYLKIPGKRMVPKDDKFVLQITEELWEATYFDQIELLAVDHPADVEIYSNEKVGPAEISEFKIHTVRDPRPVVAAHDQRGRDVLTEVSLEDGQFTKCYDTVLRQGLTTEHWLELDLGPISESGPLTLFLTGWMFPTETSISVAVSQNPANKQARPPALWVPDAQGEWKEIRPFMGFPGGKTKTIAVDLTGVFAGSDHRLRIATNMQFHWDHAFFAVGETPAEVRMQPVRLESAELHYRGFSNHYWEAGNGPDRYDYSTLLPGPNWPPMQGKFTRYGKVEELLTKTDDLLAVVGAGDEITMTFLQPEKPLPEGWKRDFILHSVGWDKDADLNTVYGQTVEPMPFNAMTKYPYPVQEGPFETAEYQAYLKKYQTRVQDYGKFWRRVKQGRGDAPTPATLPTPAEKQNAGG